MSSASRTPRQGSASLDGSAGSPITKLYRDLATSGGRNGGGLSPRTVEYVHAVLRKAFRDAIVVDQLVPSNPVERAKRPRKTLSEPGRVWTPSQLRAFLDTARRHRLFAFYRLAAYTGARRGELLNLRWRNIDLDLGEVRITGSAAVIGGSCGLLAGPASACSGSPSCNGGPPPGVPGAVIGRLGAVASECTDPRCVSGTQPARAGGIHRALAGGATSGGPSPPPHPNV